MGWFSKQVEEAKTVSDHVLSALDKSLAIIEFEPNGTILSANSNFLSVMGYRFDEIQGRHHSLFVEPSYANSAEYKEFWAKLNRKEFHTDEYKRFGNGGREIWIQATYNPVVDDSGNLLKVIKIATDVTARKLKNVENTGQINAISKSQAVIEFDLEGNILTANDNFTSTVGYSLSEIQGRHHSLFVEPEYAQSTEYKEFWQRLNRGEFVSGDFKRIGKGNKEVWIKASYNPIFDMSGKPFKVVKYATDITEQKKSDVKAKQTADLANALNVCQANVMIADNDLNIVFVNDENMKMLKSREVELKTVLPNFNADSLVGTNVDIFHKNPSHQRTMLKALAQPYTTHIKAGNLTFRLIATPWHSLEGERIGTVVEWLDMTEELAHKDALAKIAAENARIKAALDKCQANVMMADNDLNIVYLNDSVQAMMQHNQAQLQTVLPRFNANDLIGTCVDDFHKNPAHQRSLLAGLTDVYQTRLSLAGLTFDLIATPVFDDEGARLGTVVEWDDVTAAIAKQALDDKLAADNARIKIALDRCQANVMMADNDLNIIYLNESVADMMQRNEAQLKTALPSFNASQLIGTCVDSFHKKPAHQRGMLEALKDVYKTKITVAGLTFNLTATPVFDEKNNKLGTVVEWDDITEALVLSTEQKRLADENSRVKQALDNVTTNTMIANADNEIIYMNSAIHSMMRTAENDIRQALPNFDANNLLGQKMDVFHKNPAHQHRLIESLSATFATEINVGARRFSLVANPIVSDEGSRIGTVVEWGDRTAEVSIEKEIDHLVESAVAGDLSIRIKTDDKSGFFEGLSTGLNRLVGVCEGVINDTVEMLDAMAHGNLTKRIEGDYQGGFGKLKEDANATVTKLTEIIARVNQSANTVASGADEIAQGNADLSQRTEEQASSLEETAASMEEMTSTVKQNADNASIANELASDAQSKAVTGGQVVERAVKSMSEINEASNKIADIIGVIDEIAFQTNLLALNAAVEAARAGEQGRGFAVVAGEVRNLAQRSAEAAKEIKDLIRDSVAKVEDGSSLVNESGSTLKDIVQAVEKVSQMIADISVASNEQSAGIEQVNKAITQMDEMTQQNAALVEEASAAGESMSEQARAMRQLLSFFTVEAGGDSRHVEYVSREPLAKPSSRQFDPKPKTQNTGLSFSESDDEWEEF
ncbi:methyl-accepting chemotaxis protein [Algibacillus agarilyticus]|uniref:methyl-accepting chemotaxis protein n=1 Tax=Algibacillus agarilyticus TaxID=2234133 RepID=UPI000DD05639|nr:methyl-accepting chemotaxis protein [Algibacillus agarilyticus]